MSVEKTGGEFILYVVSACCLHLFVKMSEVGDFVLFFTIKRKGIQPFFVEGECFFSIDRTGLFRLLMDILERKRRLRDFPNVVLPVQQGPVKSPASNLFR